MRIFHIGIVAKLRYRFSFFSFRNRNGKYAIDVQERMNFGGVNVMFPAESPDILFCDLNSYDARKDCARSIQRVFVNLCEALCAVTLKR